MIKASELRIRNWLLPSLSKNPAQINGMFIRQCEANEQQGRVVDNWSGIPITREILEKCGFVYADDATAYRVFSRQPYLFSVCVTGKEFHLFGGQWPIGKSFKYLHELQNLFFALTGEELNISLCSNL